MKIEIDYVEELRVEPIKEIETKTGKKFYTRSFVVKNKKSSDLIILKSMEKETLEL